MTCAVDKVSFLVRLARMSCRRHLSSNERSLWANAVGLFLGAPERCFVGDRSPQLHLARLLKHSSCQGIIQRAAAGALHAAALRFLWFFGGSGRIRLPRWPCQTSFPPAPTNTTGSSPLLNHVIDRGLMGLQACFRKSGQELD